MQDLLKQKIEKFIIKEFIESIKSDLDKKIGLNKFILNPFLAYCLSSYFGNTTSENYAKALLYPRLMGTSLSTKFGDKMQKMCIQILGAKASSANGFDIEFKDKVSGKDVIAQLKAGPNTINSGDVKPVIDKINEINRLLSTNRTSEIPQFAVCILYGELSDLSGHYKKIASSIVRGQSDVPIYVGKDFWHRLTGEQDFYEEMINIFNDVFSKSNLASKVKNKIKNLSSEISEKKII